MQQVLRSERKFVLSMTDFMRKYHELQQLLHEDSHNGTTVYMVRSLYFDTIGDDDYFDKMYGLHVRKKMRLRIYDPASDFALLEMKQKQGNQQRKRSLRMSRYDAERLIKGDYSPLLTYDTPFAAECYALMTTRLYRPKAVVQYRRKAFVCPVRDTRLTFDCRIEATEASHCLFDPYLALNPVMDFDIGVLEVKYNGILLSYIKALLADLEQSEISASKYCMGRMQSYHDHL